MPDVSARSAGGLIRSDRQTRKPEAHPVVLSKAALTGLECRGLNSPPMRFRRLVAGMLSLALLNACTVSSTRIVHAPAPRAVVGEPMSCLAMSGGGIRSGAVSLGALQELYSRNALSQYELISTVSGGGYPVYGLLYRMLHNSIALRDLLRERGRFIADVERNAGIVKIGPKLVEELILQPVGLPLSWIGRPYASAQPGYIAAIHENFAGGRLSMFGRPTLADVGDILELQGFPTPIFGTAASDGATPPPPGFDYRIDTSSSSPRSAAARRNSVSSPICRVRSASVRRSPCRPPRWTRPRARRRCRGY